MQSSSAFGTASGLGACEAQTCNSADFLVSGTSCKLGSLGCSWVAVLSLGVALASGRVFCEPVGFWKRADEWRALVLAGTPAAKSASHCD